MLTTQTIAEKIQLILIGALGFGVPLLVGAGPRGDQYSFFQKYLAAPLIVTAAIIGLSLINFGIARLMVRLDTRKRTRQISEPSS